jgi:hypothetical protein
MHTVHGHSQRVPARVQRKVRMSLRWQGRGYQHSKIMSDCNTAVNVIVSKNNDELKT